MHRPSEKKVAGYWVDNLCTTARGLDVYEGKTVAVVVPAHNEEKLIGLVLETMPDFVDLIIVVDDASTDQTADIVTSYRSRLDERLLLLSHKENQGVGAAVGPAYKCPLAH